MNPIQNIRDHGTKWLGVVGSVLGGLAMYLTPEQVVSILGAKGPGAILLAGGILTYLRGRYNTKQNTPGLPPPDPSTVKSHWLVTLLALTLLAPAVVATLAVSGCATQPTANERVGINAAVAAAVAITVQHNSNDPTVWAQRAQLIVSVGEAVKPLATSETVSLPAVAAAVGPLLDRANLAPGERIAANQLVIALSQVIEANTTGTSPVAVTVADVLDSAIENARVYVPLTSKPSTIF